MRGKRGTREQLWFFLGAISPSWIVWQCSSILGISLVTMVPSTWSLNFAAVLALLAITIPLVSSKPLLVTILAAALTAWIGQVCLAFAFGAGGRRFGHCVWNVGAVGPTLVVRLTSFPDSGETRGFTLQKGVKP